MILNLNPTILQVIDTVIVTSINTGGAPGSFKYYNGTQPAPGGTETTLVATQNLSYPAHSNIANGIIYFNAIGNGLVIADATVTWMRCTDSAGSYIFDLDVSDLEPIFSKYSVSTLAGLFAHFNVSTLQALIAALPTVDFAELGGMVMSKTNYTIGDYIVIPNYLTLSLL